MVRAVGFRYKKHLLRYPKRSLNVQPVLADNTWGCTIARTSATWKLLRLERIELGKYVNTCGQVSLYAEAGTTRRRTLKYTEPSGTIDETRFGNTLTVWSIFFFFFFLFVFFSSKPIRETEESRSWPNWILHDYFGERVSQVNISDGYGFFT